MRHWPLFSLRLLTPRLELRLPRLEDLDELADRALDGIHDPGVMPFADQWTDVPPAQLPAALIRFHLGTIAEWRPDRWNCAFAVFHQGRAIGVQELMTGDFAITREVRTASWLCRTHQGAGFGTEMRAAVLHLAFTHLRAQTAISTAFRDNPASLAVSRKLEYRPDGTTIHKVRNRQAVQQRMRLNRDDFIDPAPVDVHGLEPCLPFLGLSNATG